MDRSGSRAHEWQSREYAAYWVSDAESRDHERTEQLALLASLLPFPPDAPLRVLDLGAGYGIVTGTVLRAFPRARVTLFDLSEAMLEHARSRLAPHAAQLDYAVGDLSRPDWLDAVHGPYDAVVSAAVLHNLRDGPRIAAIYRELATILSPGGAFLCLDHVSAGGRRIERQFDALRPTRRHGDEAERAAAAEAAAHAHAGAAAAAAVAAAQEAPSLRFPGSIAEHLAWLRAAGFTEVDCFWKNMHRALYGGYMPESS
ncbi:MAG TPA: class I SAM-dependent methyltransferase [Chloroflexota bacterium]|nr:class I SAM-dependent methyltransferase [Chloroflexota bacterium]